MTMIVPIVITIILIATAIALRIADPHRPDPCERKESREPEDEGIRRWNEEQVRAKKYAAILLEDTKAGKLVWDGWADYPRGGACFHTDADKNNGLHVHLYYWSDHHWDFDVIDGDDDLEFMFLEPCPLTEYLLNLFMEKERQDIEKHEKARHKRIDESLTKRRN